MILFIIELGDKTLGIVAWCSILLFMSILIVTGMIITYKSKKNEKEIKLKLLDKLINSEFDKKDKFKNEIVESFYNKEG